MRNGIKVDEYFEIFVKDIYVVGDVIIVKNFIINEDILIFLVSFVNC